MEASDDALTRGRQAYAEGAWASARESLAVADAARPLGRDDLERLATSAYMAGHDDEYLAVLERAYQAHLDAGETLRAARCAFWVGVNLAIRGEMAKASGWLGRAERMVEREGADCVERGYLLLPVALRHAAARDWEEAAGAAAQAAEIAERFSDADLSALAIQERGNALVRQRRLDEGLRLLDEAMVAATAGELSPIVTGIVYCAVIDGCQEAYALRRAQEWTAALTRWCDSQPEMVSFTGRCLVHRAEIMQLRGSWREALLEAERAGERLAAAPNQSAAAQAFYRQGEVHRLRGELEPAEGAYREASRRGFEPQPGLALLRLAQGNPNAAAAAIRRALGEATEALERARLLPASTEIALAVGDAAEARRACEELGQIAAGNQGGMLAAIVAQARGEVELAEGDARAALVSLREAWRRWLELEAPYEAARARAGVAQACRALGDEDSAGLELDAAREVFEGLGAEPDVARVASLAETASAPSTDAPRKAHGLTERELEVLRLVAAGKSNRETAEELVISEHTVARHVQNIFAKLGVSSRTAASAFAFEHDLV